MQRSSWIGLKGFIVYGLVLVLALIANYWNRQQVRASAIDRPQAVQPAKQEARPLARLARTLEKEPERAPDPRRLAPLEPRLVATPYRDAIAALAKPKHNTQTVSIFGLPNPASARLGRAAQDAQFVVLERRGGWLKVREANSKVTGWVTESAIKRKSRS